MLMQLHFVQKKDGRLVLEFSLLYRILAGIMTLIFGIVIFIFGAHTIVAYLLFGAAILSLLYDERWTFDPGKGRVEYRMGLLILGRKKAFQFSEVETVELEMFYKGIATSTIEADSKGSLASKRAKPVQKLSLILKSKQALVIEMQKYHPEGELALAAQIISNQCHIPLKKKSS